MPRKPVYLPYLGALRKMTIALFRKGYTRTRIYNEFIRGKPWGMAKKTFLDLSREWVGIEKMKDVYRFVPKHFRYSEDLYVPSSFKFKQKYQHVIEIDAIDRELGEPVKRYCQIASSTRLSPVFIEEKVAEHIDKLIESEPYLEVTDWRIKGLVKSA